MPEARSSRGVLTVLPALGAARAASAYRKYRLAKKLEQYRGSDWRKQAKRDIEVGEARLNYAKTQASTQVGGAAESALKYLKSGPKVRRVGEIARRQLNTVEAGRRARRQ